MSDVEGLVGLEALAQANRLAIVELLLAHAEALPAARIIDTVTAGKGSVPFHLHHLQIAGLVKMRFEGGRKLYSINPDALRGVVDFVTRKFGNLRAAGSES
jgi:DNA-binding transcriptional ArsR family regulator